MQGGDRGDAAHLTHGIIGSATSLHRPGWQFSICQPLNGAPPMFMRIYKCQTELPGDPPGELAEVDGQSDGGRIHDLIGDTRAFTPSYYPQEMLGIATKLHKASW